MLTLESTKQTQSTRSSTNKSSLWLNDFWIRQQGFSLRFSRFQRFEELPETERLFVLILRGDAEKARQLISAADKKIIDDLIGLLGREEMASLIFARIFELQLAELFAAGQPAATDPPIAKISAMARAEMAQDYMREERFGSAIDILRDCLPHLLWIKGAHLSRTIYSQRYFRTYSDFDIVVHPKVLPDVIQRLEAHGFRAIQSPCFSNQTGAGPTYHPMQNFLVPHSDWIPCSGLTLSRSKDFSPHVDIKLGPLDRGIQCVELERMFAESIRGICMGREYFAPSQIDHLMISLRTLEKDRFANWKTLYDIHLLATNLSAKPGDWESFMARCKTEAIEVSAWAGLLLSADRFGTLVPHSVLSGLAPKRMLLSALTAFTESPTFYWNNNSLPMLLLDALTSTDRRRKLRLLYLLFRPTKTFLAKYYLNGRTLSEPLRLFCLLCHIMVVILPAGLVRRTFGKRFWPPRNYDSVEIENRIAKGNYAAQIST